MNKSEFLKLVRWADTAKRDEEFWKRMMAATALNAVLAYDYDRIPDPEDRAAMRQAAIEIKPRLKRAATDIMEAGQQLLDVRDRCPHGQWGAWLVTEFDLSETMARNWMNAAEKFGGKSANFADLTLAAIYQLSAPSTPEAAVAAIEQRLGDGARVGVAEVKATIVQHKPPGVRTHIRPSALARLEAEFAAPSAAAPTAHCSRCGRELTDSASAQAGIGPCCARKPVGGGDEHEEGEGARRHEDKIDRYNSTPSVSAGPDVDDMQTALDESVKLQSHYAKLLNMYDGGERLTFPSANDWIKRLREIGRLPINRTS